MTEADDNLSPFQLLKRARSIVGERALALRYGERPDVVTMDPERVTVVLFVEKGVDVRGGMKITHRGLRWLTFNLNKSTGEWDQAEPVYVLNPLPEPELHLSFGVVTPEDYEDKRVFEDLCYRPGTSSCPMDNFARRSQDVPGPRVSE